MQYLVITALITLLTLAPAQASVDIAVIANRSSNLTELTRRQVVDIYMGRMITLSNGKILVPYDQSTSSSIRESFYQRLIGKSVASVNAYWARLLFTGRAFPPRQLLDSQMVLKTVEKNPHAIGYVDVNDLNDRVNVVFRINSQ